MIYLGNFFRKIVIPSFWSHKIKKKSKNIIICTKLSRLRGKFCSTALVIDTFYVKHCSVQLQDYKIDLFFEITFLSKKIYIYISSFMQFYATKTWDKLSVNIDHV